MSLRRYCRMIEDASIVPDDRACYLVRTIQRTRTWLAGASARRSTTAALALILHVQHALISPLSSQGTDPDQSLSFPQARDVERAKSQLD